MTEINACRPPEPGAARPALRSIFLRSFFIQAAWNYERFQSMGFAFGILPALRRIYPEPGKLKQALGRHLGIFNTQPYMAPFVMGNVVRMEERAAEAGGGDSEFKSMEGIKQALASSFASIGDRVFWGRLKPMTTQVCLLVWTACGFYGWLFTGRPSATPLAVIFAGPLAGILFYSAAAVTIRWRGAVRGYECGGASGCGLDALNWPRVIRLLSASGFAMSLAVSFLAIWLLAGAGSGAGSPGELMKKGALVASVLVLHRVTRAKGRSVLFAAGFILAASLLLFSLIGLSPVNLYI